MFYRSLLGYRTSGRRPYKRPYNVFIFGIIRITLFIKSNSLNCDSLRWSHTHFICIPAVHIISFSVSFLSRVDELNKLAGLQCMGLHSSAGRALQHTLTQRPRVRIPLNPRKNVFSGYFRNCLNCDSLRWSHTHFIHLATNLQVCCYVHV